MSEPIEIPNVSRPVFRAGASLNQAKAAMVMLHGRGASAGDILTLVPALADPDFSYVAPDAPGNVWYPRPFTSPLQANEPYLSSSLTLVGHIVSHLVESGIARERIAFLGFSQGACLALEYAARHAQRYGAVVGFSGGLIGPDDLQRADQGSLAGSPVFLGCSDRDPFIPKYRVEQAANHLRRLGGTVTMRLYQNMPHTINDDEVEFVRGLMTTVKTP